MIGEAVPRAVLFDLDSTLTDRDASIARYALVFEREFADRLSDLDHAMLVETLRKADGGGYRSHLRAPDILAQLPWQSRPAERTIEEHWEVHFPGSVVAAPGLHETLSVLRDRGLSIAVVTNGGSVAQNEKIDRLEIRELLSAVIVSKAVGVAKPEPAIFELALSQLGVRASEAWFVGDHPGNDVIGAGRIGLEAVWLRGSHEWPPEHPAPSLAIDRLAELLDLLA